MWLLLFQLLFYYRVADDVAIIVAVVSWLLSSFSVSNQFSETLRTSPETHKDGNQAWQTNTHKTTHRDTDGDTSRTRGSATGLGPISTLVASHVIMFLFIKFLLTVKAAGERWSERRGAGGQWLTYDKNRKLLSVLELNVWSLLSNSSVECKQKQALVGGSIIYCLQMTDEEVPVGISQSHCSRRSTLIRTCEQTTPMFRLIR